MLFRSSASTAQVIDRLPSIRHNFQEVAQSRFLERAFEQKHIVRIIFDQQNEFIGQHRIPFLSPESDVRNIAQSPAVHQKGFTPFNYLPLKPYYPVKQSLFHHCLFMSNISVLLVDDHNIVRQGLRALLIAEGDMTIVAEAQTGREAVQLAAKLHPEVVVMDLAMPLLNGWEATRQIVKAVPSARIVVLSTYGDDDHIQQAIAAGAAAYLLKQTAAADLVKAIREVKKGNAYFRPAIAQRFREQTCRPATEGEAPKPVEPELTPREAEVLQLIAEGFANKQIAAELGLSVKTIEKHRQQVMHKLRIHDIA